MAPIRCLLFDHWPQPPQADASRRAANEGLEHRTQSGIHFGIHPMLLFLSTHHSARKTGSPFPHDALFAGSVHNTLRGADRRR